jgi:hypothetical protein
VRYVSRIAVSLLCFLLAALAPIQGAPRTEEEIPLTLRVNHAIARGVEHLKSRQRADGSVGGRGTQHPGGLTALVAFTWAKSGVRRGDPALSKALAALAEVDFTSTYSAAVHLLLCEALRDPGLAAAAQRSLDFLVKNQDASTGAWAYPWGKVDSSNTQFALLGLRAGSRLGLLVPEKTLLAAVDALAAFDHPKVGFTYEPGGKGTYAGITAAGLAGLAVLEELAQGSPRLRSALEKRAREREKAERWLTECYDPKRNHHPDGTWSALNHFAYLWAVERWCGLAGRARLGERDWYAEGAAWLVSVQADDGSFGSTLEDTCFALLFLRRATVSAGSEVAELNAEIERLRAMRRARHSSPGSAAQRLTDWWMAGPWIQGGDGPILLAPPFAPADVEPRARLKIARREWTAVRLRSDQWSDLELLEDHVGDQLLWLLSTRLTVEGERALEVLLWLELDDGWDVWLDGASLSRERRRALGVQADVALTLRLSPGPHRLTILVEDRDSASSFGALLSSLENGPPPESLRIERHEAPERAR